jgi:hypothetical protein
VLVGIARMKLVMRIGAAALQLPEIAPRFEPSEASSNYWCFRRYFSAARALAPKQATPMLIEPAHPIGVTQAEPTYWPAASKKSGGARTVNRAKMIAVIAS